MIFDRKIQFNPKDQTIVIRIIGNMIMLLSCRTHKCIVSHARTHLHDEMIDDPYHINLLITSDNYEAGTAALLMALGG